MRSHAFAYFFVPKNADNDNEKDNENNNEKDNVYDNDAFKTHTKKPPQNARMC